MPCLRYASFTFTISVTQHGKHNSLLHVYLARRHIFISAVALSRPLSLSLLHTPLLFLHHYHYHQL